VDGIKDEFTDIGLGAMGIGLSGNDSLSSGSIAGDLTEP
jgi:hypothetical protein